LVKSISAYLRSTLAGLPFFSVSWSKEYNKFIFAYAATGKGFFNVKINFYYELKCKYLAGLH